MIIGGTMGIISRFKKLFKNDKEKEGYEKGLAKTSNNFVGSLNMLSKKHKKIDDAFFEELEEILISADIGAATVNKYLSGLLERKDLKKLSISELKEAMVEELVALYGKVDNELKIGELSVYLFVGVNGSGKTTSLAKMGARLKEEGKRVLFIAGDTFRAGAVEQLNEWAERLEIPVVSSFGKDSSSVIYDGIVKAQNEKFDVVLIDTAGRLQTRDNLMSELKKINQVIGKLIPEAPHETFLVIDATTGQNGISQAMAFKEITDVSGIILTKLDGTAKGGIVIAIKDVTGIPVKFIGFGEKKDDLKLFELEKYIYGLFKGWEDET